MYNRINNVSNLIAAGIVLVFVLQSDNSNFLVEFSTGWVVGAFGIRLFKDK